MRAKPKTNKLCQLLFPGGGEVDPCAKVGEARCLA